MTITTTPRTETLAAIIRRGDLDGYVAGTPLPGYAVQIDADVCAESTCLNCGTLGLEYRPFTRWSQWGSVRRCIGYRAFAVCPTCGLTQEM